MKKPNWVPLYNSIFVRIYAGLVLVAFLASFFAYSALLGINSYRSKLYREDIASAASYIITQGLARQTTALDQEHWLSDASLLLNLNLELADPSQFNFSRREQKRLDAGLAVVIDDKIPGVVQVVSQIPNQKNLLTSRIGTASIREQQIKALPVFVLDDLVHHPNDLQHRLTEIQQHFPFPIFMTDSMRLNIDDDQRAQLRRKEVVLLFKQNESSPSLTLISPTMRSDQVLYVGPIALFNWLPFKVMLLISFLTLLVLSFGVYGLIVPLHRKIRQVQLAVSRVRAGQLDARVAVEGKDEIATLAGSFNDMTDHVQRLINAQRELTRAVSHELRTPVARIRFGLEMLADTDNEQSRWDQQSAIDKDIETLNDLIDEILTYAKLEEGTPSLTLKPVPLRALLQQIEHETISLGLPNKVNVRLPAEEVTAIADEKYLHRVLQNLAGNAMRHAHSQILISADVVNGRAFISVEDDGAGIPEADRDKVFLPFARLDDSRTRASGGYGLGLSIVQRICYWFKGEMTVDQSPSLRGARFSMSWPARPPI